MVIQFSIDKENGGLYWIKRKRSLQVCLWFIAVRIFLMSESTLHEVIYLAKTEEKLRESNR